MEIDHGQREQPQGGEHGPKSPRRYHSGERCACQVPDDCQSDGDRPRDLGGRFDRQDPDQHQEQCRHESHDSQYRHDLLQSIAPQDEHATLAFRSVAVGSGDRQCQADEHDTHDANDQTGSERRRTEEREGQHGGSETANPGRQRPRGNPSGGLPHGQAQPDEQSHDVERQPGPRDVRARIGLDGVVGRVGWNDVPQAGLVEEEAEGGPQHQEDHKPHDDAEHRVGGG